VQHSNISDVHSFECMSNKSVDIKFTADDEV
jgi:hypothetical protein